MSKSLLAFIVCSALASAVLAQTPSPQALADARSACETDVQNLCAGVQSGGGRIIACLKQHQGEVSSPCKSAITKAMQGSGGEAGAPPPPAAIPAPKPASSAKPSAASAPASSSSPTGFPGKSAGGADRYFLMKPVQIIDQSFAQGKGGPAYDLMIPTTWQFKGWVNVNAAEYGCFADWFAVTGDAKNADGSIDLQILPQYTFQYVDDPAAQQHVQQENQLATRVGMKTCPLRAPMHAADFLRQEMIGKYRKGKTVVSIEPFPELDQIARYRLGLPANNTGASVGGVRTEAARARLAYDDANGKPIEEWVSAVIVVRTVPGGRGAIYDWHANMVMLLQAPKGKLDENDKLFRLIASTLHPDPQWQQYSNNVIVGLYRKKQEEEAKQSAIIAQLQQYAIATINGVVANQQRGSYNSALGADQGIRGVQTFRDPSTGATFELSNQYDHAWLNGSNQYVMSDDPSFNPNGSLNGSWTSLQPVRPQP